MNRVNQQEADQNPEATLYIGNLDENVTEAILYELMLQAGPIVHINLPKDRVSQTHQGYGFVEYKTEADANYAASIMNQIWLFGKSIRVSKSASDKQNGFEIGATLFVGSLDPLVDESTLQQTFSVFGPFAKPPRISRDTDGSSKGYGFVSFTDFEHSDRALESMDKQYLMNQQITVTYAFKHDGKGGRHGDETERLLALQAKKNQYIVPQQAIQAPPPGATSRRG
ncbi:hypothetical protein B0I72DRAFT_132537 [Yarrowia lipolytica]|jgi:splicing factor 3B subunit 4|uniref:YALI0E15356p n=2 Tax=Yarrowia lipolytica TaxID=4952 RepID=Q6C5T3_YARLI|nr:YALI0E15356p [Yarrowia lipolytica CLIB122]AOW05453.1 hypothetical protein YALI1_E18411g [Yarrowia lipolytica]KAB8282048.1 hypothetical protein BKA91DRAFT_139079 [Yarrowia lipolytica]KAE8171094.1 hypothetical protein BKA90DRAFT_139554 [Yarrowia lipolytica]KAJ8056958.1 hypothetical protein LXG23DRAFT_46379 [Yarrowia lipolytica]RDW28689.1 hypothetical protein B0I71DRAFT_126851 [Yarrowia lipolytica]|eukprot:XP_503979.1 YALI0E15356p [Yarrowia lipolytica CLIB122]